MLLKSTITLLRIPFSFFLMPVYFFALSQVDQINYRNALLSFIIIHFFMYPASNGYNSYMDQDDDSIGMLEKPPKPTRQLFWIAAVLDAIAILASFFVNEIFAACIIANVIASRAYSYRGIRLKQYPFTGFMTVILFQGAVTYLMVYAASSVSMKGLPWQGMLISSLLFGGFYPLTQIYQHQQDLRDGVVTISYKLGVTGTFLFSGIMYALAEVVIFWFLAQQDRTYQFWWLQLFFLPIVVYFIYWWNKVAQDKKNASFHFSFRMNLVAATATNARFLLLYFMNH